MDKVEIDRPLNIGAVLQILEQGGYEPMKLEVHDENPVWFELHFKLKQKEKK